MTSLYLCVIYDAVRNLSQVYATGQMTHRGTQRKRLTCRSGGTNFSCRYFMKETLAKIYY